MPLFLYIHSSVGPHEVNHELEILLDSIEFFVGCGLGNLQFGSSTF